MRGVWIMEQNVPCGGVMPVRGTKHDGIFEALGVVQGHDLDGFVVTLESLHVLVDAAGRRLALLAQPFLDAHWSEAQRSLGLVYQLGKMQQVRQAALALRTLHESRAQHAGGRQPTECAGETLRMPSQTTLEQTLDERLPASLVGVEFH